MLPKKVSAYFNLEIGLSGGLVMGIIVFLINYAATQDTINSTIAAIKQGVYTFFFGGAIMRMCEVIAVKIRNRYWGVILSMLIPSLVSLLLTFGVHSLRGTPRPFESTVPTAFFVIPATLVWGYRKRYKHDAAKAKKIPVS